MTVGPVWMRDDGAMTGPSHPRVSRRGLLAVWLSVPIVSGCGASPQQVGPQGVDELQVPTASPDPADFVERIDNPWLPYVPESRWRYEQVGQRGSVELRAGSSPRTIAGVRTTPVHWTSGRQELATLWYAQDRAGNVWWFGARVGGGAEVEWSVGAGVEAAGLVMPASPRRGDGYVAVEGRLLTERLTVDKVDAPAPIGLDLPDAGPLLLLERTSEGVGGMGDGREYYQHGVGLVARIGGAGADDTLVLVDHTGSGG